MQPTHAPSRASAKALFPALAAALAAAFPAAAPAAEEAAAPASAAPAAAAPSAAAGDARAVLAGAGAWLAAQQKEDGSFSNPKHPGLTAIALWGLEGAAAAKESAGEDASAERAAAEKAEAWILSRAQDDGGFYTRIPGRAGGGLSTYNTALSLAALSFSRRTDPEFVGKVLAARDFLAASQLEGDDGFAGGFGYDKAAPHRYADLNNAVFAIEAMRRTQRFEDMRPAGAKKADLDWDAALSFVESLHNGDGAGDGAGGFAYSHADAKAGAAAGADGRIVLRSYGSITYSGLLALVYCKLPPNDPRVRSALDWASRHWTLDENPGMGEQGLYFFYDIVGRALSVSGFESVPRPAERGGPVEWRSELLRKLRSLQRPDGSFANRNGRYWENDPVLATGYSAVAAAFAAGFLR